ncbi:hypothetical protein EMCRGX_G028330 [Ephydatia muelleri]|eukprot:Em0020g354a
MSSGEAERPAPSVPTAANDVAQILEGMRQMREELRSVRQGQEETALRIERNARKDTYSFKRRGNELQYRFNAEVADKVAAAATSIEKVETTSIRSKELLDWAARDLREGGVFTSGVWPLLSNLEDPELRRLAQALPATVLSSRADSTTKNSRGGGACSVIAVEEAVHALSWLHGLAGLQPLGGSTLVKSTLEGLRRMLAKPKVRKEPVTADILKAMVEAAGSAPSLTEVRLLAVCLVAFAGFMRCDELIRLRCEDITFNAEGMIINIVSSKTDQYREGSSLVIARTGGLTCPVGMMEKYFLMDHTPKACVFRGISVTKEGERLRKTGGLSYTRLRELLLQKITQLGYDPKAFGMHSLRAGGATAAANAGVPDRLFKRHGRWKSESAKDGYVKDSVERRLEVSKQLGI